MKYINEIYKLYNFLNKNIIYSYSIFLIQSLLLAKFVLLVRLFS